MRTTRLYSTLVALLLLCSMALPSMANPRLTVVVVADGMTTDNLQVLRTYWPAGGLRNLSEEAFQTTIHFPHMVNGGAETMATLMTGTTPSYHGIMSDCYFSRSDRTIQEV